MLLALVLVAPGTVRQDPGLAASPPLWYTLQAGSEREASRALEVLAALA
jgi:hypothetical protein